MGFQLADEQRGAVVDDLDRRIMIELQEDGRRPYREISQRLGVAPGTVRSRVLQLVEEGVLRVIAVPDPYRLGYRFHATVGLRVDPGHSEAVADALAEREEVGWVGLTSSGFDVMFEVALPDSRAFGAYKEQVLARLPGCRAIEVYEIWGIRKFHYGIVEEGQGEPFGIAAESPAQLG
jgi:Lrp/AsnC family transcriptional regulator, regulator for asnA, asnC and gidA